MQVSGSSPRLAGGFRFGTYQRRKSLASRRREQHSARSLCSRHAPGLYVVSDVSRLWILADVYGADLPWVHVGAPAQLRIEGLEAEPREASVAFLPPTMEEATRTLKVRFEIDNEDGRARPGAFATVEMSIDLGSSLAIPESAVIHAGDRAIAFVVQGTRIEPRSVELGPVVEGHYRVIRGVSAGESVAVGAQFLIDSESRLRATSASGAQHAGH
jgi:membrane fusion protein, copper/silver efflux system